MNNCEVQGELWHERKIRTKRHWEQLVDSWKTKTRIEFSILAQLEEEGDLAEEMRPVSQLLYLGRYYAKVGKNWSVKFCFPLLSHQCEIKRTVRIS